MVLLIGSSGYVGSAFQKYFKERDIPYSTLSVRYSTEIDSISKFIRENEITAVINCSGYVGIPNVDACEDNKVECLLANGFLPAHVAKACAHNNIPHVFVSSGCIFFDRNCEDGKKPSTIFTNESEPNFTFERNYRSWYSGTKARGEKSVSSFNNTSICRLRIPFNSENNPRNFLYKVINYPRLVNTTNSFSCLDEFVDACYKIALLPISGTTAKIYNLTQPGYMTTHDVVKLLKKYNLIDEKVFFETYDDFLKTVRAPRSNCVLRSCSERAGMPFKLTPIRKSIETAIKNYTK